MMKLYNNPVIIVHKLDCLPGCTSCKPVEIVESDILTCSGKSAIKCAGCRMCRPHDWLHNSTCNCLECTAQRSLTVEEDNHPTPVTPYQPYVPSYPITTEPAYEPKDEGPSTCQKCKRLKYDGFKEWCEKHR